MRNGVTIGVALLCIFAGAAATILAAREGSPNPPARRRATRASTPVAATALPRTSETELPSQAAEREAGNVASSPPTSALPCPPPDADADPQRRAEWLLALPDADLSKIVNTPQLDGWVGETIGAIHRRGGTGREILTRISEFTTRLNERILAVRRK